MPLPPLLVVTPRRELCSPPSKPRRDGSRQPEGGAGLEASVLFLLEGSPVPGDVLARRVVYVPDHVMRKLTGVVTAEGVGATALLPMPDTYYVCSSEGEEGPATPTGTQGGVGMQHSGPADLLEWGRSFTHVLALDRVQDPGNLGTLARTAIALGWDGLFLLPGCCDPFNEKVVRASRGAMAKFPLATGTWGDLNALVRARGLTCVAADVLEGAAVTNGRQSAALSPLPSCCLVLGSESQGVSEETKRHCRAVTIPMPGDMESLNVAVAGGILMFSLKNMIRSEALQ
eukprot:jgi/Mesvir1/10967/Mv07852-RA.2